MDGRHGRRASEIDPQRAYNRAMLVEIFGEKTAAKAAAYLRKKRLFASPQHHFYMGGDLIEWLREKDSKDSVAVCQKGD